MAKLSAAAVSVALLALVIAIVFLGDGTDSLIEAAGQLSLASLGLVFAALLANALFATLRFFVIARDLGHRIGFWQALAAVSGGNLGGALFFQLAGQLMARGLIMSRGGVSFSSVVVITFYERLVAAAVSALLALGGAYFIFGQIAVDTQQGGLDLIKITVGLIAAATLGAILGYLRMVRQAAASAMTQHFVLRFLRIVGLSVLVQLPMMAAYIAAANTLSPEIPFMELAAASALVMFAASIPISLAGWGVRELSAIAALGAIGMSMSKALLAAVVVGVGSLAVMGLLAVVSALGWSDPDRQVSADVRAPLDYGKVVAWAVPLGAATLVLFQIYIPITSGTLLNVNLADPLAILGGSLFVLAAYQQRRMPQWRFAELNVAVAAMTLMFTVSLLVGWASVGWTEWAWVNRYLGWFVLLAFGATGALIVKDSGPGGLNALLLTYAGATAAVVAVELVSMVLAQFKLWSMRFPLEGFAQNRNFFAFQTLMAIAAAIVAARGFRLRVILIGTFFAGLWFAGSRSAWLALLFLLAVAVYLRAIEWREIAGAFVFALLAVLLVIVFGLVGAYGLFDLRTWSELAGGILGGTGLPTPQLIPTPQNTAERMLTIRGGFSLFLENPIIGAGLGAFRSQLILATSGIPLLIHSTYVWLLAEMGLIGFLVFAIPAAVLLLRELQRRDQDAAGTLVVLCLVVFAVFSLPADMLYQRTFWLLMGAGLALLHVQDTGGPKSEQA